MGQVVENIMRRTKGRIGMFAAFVMAALALSGMPAKAQAVVNGTNVKEVAYSNGILRQKKDGSWFQRTSGVAVNPHFTEDKRDEWSVYLTRDDGAKMQIDLYRKEFKVQGGAAVSNLTESSASTCSVADTSRVATPGSTGRLTFVYDVEAKDDDDVFNFESAGFKIKPGLRTYILIHGYDSSPDTFGTDIPSLLREINTGGANVITVDWNALFPGNEQSSWNMIYNWMHTLDRYNRTYRRAWNVGWELSDLLQDELCIEPENTEIVANSLGALVAGAMANDYYRDTGKKIDRIVGLDAVGQYMSGIGTDVRLTSGDATKVVALHSSDAAHFAGCNDEAVGWYDPYADLDIYIYTNQHDTAEDTVKQLLGSGTGCYRNDHGYVWDMYRALLRGNHYSYATSRTWDENLMANTGFSYEKFGSLTGSVTLDDDSAEDSVTRIERLAKPTCAATTLTRSESYHSWVKFKLPFANDADQIFIPGGAYNNYVFPACHRVHWNNHTYRCSNGSWSRIQGESGADGLCHGGTPDSPYIEVGNK